MTREDRMFTVSLCCLSAACVIVLIGLAGLPTAVGGLVIVAAVGVTWCLAMLADGR